MILPLRSNFQHVFRQSDIRFTHDGQTSEQIRASAQQFLPEIVSRHEGPRIGDQLFDCVQTTFVRGTDKIKKYMSWTTDQDLLEHSKICKENPILVPEACNYFAAVKKTNFSDVDQLTSILGLYMDKQPASYYVDHENPTKDQKEDAEADFPFYQMGAIEVTHDLKDEKTTTDKAKIFSKSWTDTGFVLTVRISSSNEAGTVRIFANIPTLDSDAGDCYLDPHWGYLDGEHVQRAAAVIAEDVMDLGVTHEWKLSRPIELPQAIQQGFALTSCVKRDDGDSARLPVPDPKAATVSAKSAY